MPSLLAIALMAGCASMPRGGGAIRITLSATPTCNRCNRPAAYPLTCRVLLVSDTAPIKALGLKQVWGKEADLFKQALLAPPREMSVSPGEVGLPVPIEVKPGATAVLVIGNFYCSKTDHWYVEHLLSKGHRLKLLAGSDSLVVIR